MTAHISLYDQLQRRITRIGTVGGVMLLIFIGLDFDILFGAGYATLGPAGIAHEMMDHVILPLLVLLYPTYLGVQWMMKVTLEPLETAIERIEAAQGSERGFRIDTEGLPLEAVPFLDSINNLLGRLDEAAARHEAFAADVAHELRTPLAIVRLKAERIDSEEAAQLGAELAAMGRLVEQLYLVAQLDAHAAAPSFIENVRLDEVATDVAMQMTPAAIDNNRILELEIRGRTTVRGRRETLASALRNLIENAIRVTPANGMVTVIAGPGPILRVRDQGPGLAPDQLAVLCQRFRRLDNASAGGAGLGLAIVLRIMNMHGGTFRSDPKHKELHLVFPAMDGNGE